MSVIMGGKKRSTRRRSTTRKQRGGNLAPLHPLAISGYETPVITQHLPAGAISYNAQKANIEGGKRSRSGRSRRSSKRSSSKRSSKRSKKHKSRSRRHKQSAKGAFGISPYLARMAHPRSAAGGKKRY